LFCNVSSLSRPRASEFWERIGGGEASTGTWQFERVHLKLIGAIKSEQPVLAIKLPARCTSWVISLAATVEARTKHLIISITKAKALALVDLNRLSEVCHIHYKLPIVL